MNAKGGTVEAKDILVRVSGDMGYTICTEVGKNIDRKGNKILVNHRATNIFRYENGIWKLIHHHTDLTPALQAASGQK